jgi:hypothetical protein
VSAAFFVGVKISPTPEISTAILHAKLIILHSNYLIMTFLKNTLSKPNRLERYWFAEPGQNCPSIQVILTDPVYTILPLNPDLSKFKTDPRFPEELGSKKQFYCQKR